MEIIHNIGFLLFFHFRQWLLGMSSALEFIKGNEDCQKSTVFCFLFLMHNLPLYKEFCSMSFSQRDLDVRVHRGRKRFNFPMYGHMSVESLTQSWNPLTPCKYNYVLHCCISFIPNVNKMFDRSDFCMSIFPTLASSQSLAGFLWSLCNAARCSSSPDYSTPIPPPSFSGWCSTSFRALLLAIHIFSIRFERHLAKMRWKQGVERKMRDEKCFTALGNVKPIFQLNLGVQ